MPKSPDQYPVVGNAEKSLKDGEILFRIITEKIETDLRRIPYDVLINPDGELIRSLTNKSHLPSGCGVVPIHKVYADLFTGRTQNILAWRSRLKALLGWKNKGVRWYGKITRTGEVVILVPLKEGLLDFDSLYELREKITASCILLEQYVRIETTLIPIIDSLNNLKITIGWLSVVEIKAELVRICDQLVQLSQSPSQVVNQNLSDEINSLNQVIDFLTSKIATAAPPNEIEVDV